jgi:hypothetical protein
MSLIEMVQQNQLILISFGVALLPLFIGLLYLTVVNLHKLVTALWMRLKTRRAARALAGVEHTPDMDLTDLVDDLDELELEEVEEIPAPEAAPSLQQTLSAETTSESQASEAENSGGMQDLLNSVFTDDELFAHYERMSEGLDPVDAEDLAEFSDAIAARLRQMAPAEER